MIDKLKDILSFLKTKVFLINLGIAVLMIALLLGFTNTILSSYTRHGESITVPNLKGQTPEQVQEFLKDKGLRFSIVDSVFDFKKAKGIVLDQDPQPDSKVKENRTIYLTVNAIMPPQVKMPNLVDVSYRQAEAILQTYGLKVGELIYKPDLAKNAVLGQQIGYRDIKP